MKSLSRDEILRLSPTERLTLIGDLRDSLDDRDISLPQAQTDEIQRRLDNFESDALSAITWEQLRAELAERNT